MVCTLNVYLFILIVSRLLATFSEGTDWLAIPGTTIGKTNQDYKIWMSTAFANFVAQIENWLGLERQNMATLLVFLEGVTVIPFEAEVNTCISRNEYIKLDRCI